MNLGDAYEAIGNLAEAKRYYDLAAGLGLVHQDESYSPSAEPRDAA